MDLVEVNLDWQHFHSLVENIAQQIKQSQWEPDYIVGVVGGGAIAAVILGDCLDKPVWTLKVNPEDPDQCECNCWMPEDAVYGKNILLVDTVNDTGKTFSWIEKDWFSSVEGIVDSGWDSYWHFNIRLAVVCSLPNSPESVDYCGMNENFATCRFPWNSKKTA
jgi:hypoxanthine phosphoribosyltransferase